VNASDWSVNQIIVFSEKMKIKDFNSIFMNFLDNILNILNFLIFY